VNERLINEVFVGASAPEVDVAIVGGGPAGLVAATVLIRERPDLADRVVVLERATYPREKPCAGAVGERGLAILRELGLEPAVPHVPIVGMTLRTGFGDRTARPGAIGRVVRRLEFDDEMARLARTHGVRIVEGTKVERVTVAGDGATLHCGAAKLRARLVIGADGVGSVVGKALGSGRGRFRAQAIEVDTDLIDDDPPRGVLRFDISDRTLPGYAWDFATVLDGQAKVCRGIYHLKSFAAETDIGTLLDTRLRRQGLDPARCVVRRYAERGLALDVSLARGPLMLCGEAAGIDPVTGEGIAQAIEYGALAGRFARDVLAGTAQTSDWTSVVHRSRLGRDLAMRARLVELTYGRARPLVERALFLPGVFALGCCHFGGISLLP
jgi:flavin-dependent dehydrogenase